jgi:hypothetical protein
MRFKAATDMFGSSLRGKMASRLGRSPYTGPLLHRCRHGFHAAFIALFRGVFDGKTELLLVKRLAHEKMNVSKAIS